MKNPFRLLSGPALLLGSFFVLGSCGGSGAKGIAGDPNATSTTLRIESVVNGFGRLLPHVVHAVDPLTGAVSPTQLVEIRTIDDLLANPSSILNPVLPPSAWPTAAVTPSNQPGNHFVVVRFSRTLDVTSILDPTAAGQGNNGLTGAITVVAYDPATGASEQVKGRGFINGATFFGNPPAGERWVAPSGRNHVKVLGVNRGGVIVTPGVGFPGTDDPAGGVFNGAFQNAGAFLNKTTFVFVVDSDGDLSTYETFPQNRVIRVVINASVKDRSGRTLEAPGIGTSVVGADTTPPRSLLDGVGGNPVTFPVDLSSDVPCDVEIHWSFPESCQPHSIGPLPKKVAPTLSSEFTVEFRPAVAVGQPPSGQRVQLPYTVLPVSPFNFTEFKVKPVTPFPGSDPMGAITDVFITYFQNAATDLFGNQDSTNTDFDNIQFSTGDCPGLVNAPVSPGVIYVASNGGGQTGGIRVIDLDGFGQGTGDPTFDSNDPLYNVTFNENGEPITGDISKFPFNPNLQSPGIFPPLTADTTSLAGGSRGVFQLSQDSKLSTQLVTGDTVGTVADMTLGHPMDLLFNNFDCLSGGQNRCAQSGLQLNPLNATIAPGNPITFAPHPNPPRIRLAPSCFSPLIQTEEPSFNQGGATNFLSPGDAFGTVGGQGPSGLLTENPNYAGFFGPSFDRTTGCPTFTLRQQVGHILYVLDVQKSQVVALNSNRMTVIDTIPVSDPKDMAIAPDLNLLAVSNKGINSVTFIDTDPFSPTFHEVIKITPLIDRRNNRIGLGPTEIVWQPDDEDVLVVCERSNSMAIISTGDLQTRKIIPGVAQPRLLAVSNRDAAWGFQTDLYYAYVIAQDGRVTIFESGPDGPQGIGFDDFIGIPSLEGRAGFDGPTAVQPDPSSLFHAIFVAHREGTKGAVSILDLQNAPFGAQNIQPGAFFPDPNFRTKEWKVRRDYNGVFSSPSIVDIAFDDLNNTGAVATTTSAFATVFKAIPHSSKSMIRNSSTGVSFPRFLFAANSNGKVDVIKIDTGQQFIPSLTIPGAKVLCHFWRE